MLIASLILTPLVLGLVLLIVGVRGKRIDDHPLCRRCGFDLIGKPPDSTRCSECGAELARRRAIRIGHRRMKPLALALAALLLLPGATGVGTITFLHLQAGGIDAWKPFWLLRFEAKKLSGESADAALRELITRAANTNLTQAQVDIIADTALDRGASPATSMSPLWYDLIEQASMLGMLSNERWRRYCLQRANAELVFEVRPRVRFGDDLPIRVTTNPPRLPRRFNISILTYNILIDDRQIIYSPGQRMRSNDYVRDLTGRYALRQHITPREQGPLLPGPHTITAQVPISISQNKLKPKWETVTLVRAWTLLPSEEESVTLRRDDALRQPIRNAITLEQLGLRGNDLRAQWVIKDLPIGITLTAFARYGGIEVPIGTIAATPRATPRNVVTYGAARQLRDQPIEIILRTDPAAATRTTDILEIWDGELRLENMPVSRP